MDVIDESKIWTVNGMYTFMGPDGKKYAVHYESDDKGYRATVDEMVYLKPDIIMKKKIEDLFPPVKYNWNPTPDIRIPDLISPVQEITKNPSSDIRYGYPAPPVQDIDPNLAKTLLG